MLPISDPADNTAHMSNMNYKRLLKRGLRQSLEPKGLSSHAIDTWWREVSAYTTSARDLGMATTSGENRRQ